MEFVGIAISLGSSALASLGVNLQALGLQKDITLEDEPLLIASDSPLSESNLQKSTLRSKRTLWIIGFTLYIIFETFGSVIALAFISPVILAPLGASGLVFNVLWSKVLLGTRLCYLDAVGTGAIGIGTGLISWFGSSLPDGGKTIDDLISHLSHPSVISYFLVQFSFMIMIFLVIKYFELGFEFFKIASDFIANSPQNVSPTSIMSEKSHENLNRFSEVIGILYSILGGIAASETLLLTKTGIDLLLFSIFHSDNQFKGFISFLLLACIGSSIFIQLSCLNRALGYEEPVVVVPLFYSVYTCLSVLNTIVYLNSSEINNYIFLLIGLGFLIGGVWVLRLARLKTASESASLESD